MPADKKWNSSTLVLPQKKLPKACPGSSLRGAKLYGTALKAKDAQKGVKKSDALLVRSLIDRGTQKVVQTRSQKPKEDLASQPYEGSSTSQDSISSSLDHGPDSITPNSVSYKTPDAEREFSAESRPASAEPQRRDSCDQKVSLSPEASELSSNDSTSLASDSSAIRLEKAEQTVPEELSGTTNSPFGPTPSVACLAPQNHKGDQSLNDDLNLERADGLLKESVPKVSARSGSKPETFGPVDPDSSSKSLIGCAGKVTSTIHQDDIDVTPQFRSVSDRQSEGGQKAQGVNRQYQKRFAALLLFTVFGVTSLLLRYEMLSASRYCGALPT